MQAIGSIAAPVKVLGSFATASCTRGSSTAYFVVRGLGWRLSGMRLPLMLLSIYPLLVDEVADPVLELVCAAKVLKPWLLFPPLPLPPVSLPPFFAHAAGINDAAPVSAPH